MGLASRALLAGGIFAGVATAGFLASDFSASPYAEKAESLVQQQKKNIEDINDCNSSLRGEKVGVPLPLTLACPQRGGFLSRFSSQRKNSDSCYQDFVNAGTKSVAESGQKFEDCQIRLDKESEAPLNELVQREASLRSDLAKCQKRLGSRSVLADRLPGDVACGEEEHCSQQRLKAARKNVEVLNRQLAQCNAITEQQVSESLGAYDDYRASLNSLAGVQSSLRKCQAEKGVSWDTGSPPPADSVTMYSRKEDILSASRLVNTHVAGLKKLLYACEKLVVGGNAPAANQ